MPRQWISCGILIVHSNRNWILFVRSIKWILFLVLFLSKLTIFLIVINCIHFVSCSHPLLHKFCLFSLISHSNTSYNEDDNARTVLLFKQRNKKWSYSNRGIILKLFHVGLKTKIPNEQTNVDLKCVNVKSENIGTCFQANALRNWISYF